MADVDDVYETATRKGEEERAAAPIPVAVRFDASNGRIVVDFENGASFLVPARRLQGLEAASDGEIAEVELLGETGLHFETLDVDFTVAGLMAGVFGNARFMAEHAKPDNGRRRSPTQTRTPSPRRAGAVER